MRAYNEVLKIKEALKSEKELYFSQMDYDYDEEENTLYVKGIALYGGQPVEYYLPEGEAEVLKFNKYSTKFINRSLGLPDDADSGFEITVDLGEKKEEPKRFEILVENEHGRGVLEIRKDYSKTLTPIETGVKYLKMLKNEGLKKTYETYQKKGNLRDDPYHEFLDSITKNDPEQVKRDIEAFEKKPKISIVVPVYNLEEKYLRRMIESILNQSYTNLELCLADDNSPKDKVRRILGEYAAKDDRVKVVFRKTNGHISEATNSALELVTGDYVGFMDHDDTIEPDTLYEYVKLINEHDDADIIYCDQDFIDKNEIRSVPFLKANYNPRLLLGHNFISHFLVVNKELITKKGGLRSKYNGSQDYDFLLRIIPEARGIYHIPKILYHWRQLEGSVAEDPNAKDYAYDAGKDALNEMLRLQGAPAEIVEGEFSGTYELRGKNHPSVSIIIVARADVMPLSDKTLYEMAEHTDYDNYEILAVNFTEPLEHEKVKTYWNNKPFTRNEFYDYAASKATGEYLLFIEPGVVPANPNWLSRMVDETFDPKVGIVGGLLIDPSDYVLNAGVTYDYPGKFLMYSHHGVTVGPDQLGYYFRLLLPQYVTSVSTFCVLINHKLFEEVGGFSKDFDHPLSDVELSVKARKLGYETVITPFAKLIWTNGLVRMGDRHSVNGPFFYLYPIPDELEQFAEMYTEEECNDPYTNDVIKRFKRKIDDEYKGTEEYTIV